ncbi:MAG TPA: DNA-processing protein DprA [Candidatus Kapabacteria bacterium]|nr:DNA-processing protein DprA [Candidatus Kapabacteria bacterium]
MQASELLYYYALYLSEGIGAQRLVALRTYFGNSEKAFNASSRELSKVPGFGKVIVEQLISLKEESLAIATKQLSSLPEDTTILTFFDEDYPRSLKDIYNPPALLFLRGNRDLLSSERNIAVIGTRKMSDYGRRVVTSVCKSFAEQSIVVVSGFALGIDTAAHKAVFDAGGSTIAVLGSGIDVIYPSSNKQFSKELITSGRGLIISELPMGASPDAKNFPWRNRIVSGLSNASVIIESEEQGGSMITANIALDQNREIYALPGDVDRPMSRGPNFLLVENRAKPFRTAQDILKGLGWDSPLPKGQPIKDRKIGLSKVEEGLVSILETAAEPVHIDQLAERAGLAVQLVLVHLLDLEFRDIVRQLPGKHFSTIF